MAGAGSLIGKTGAFIPTSQLSSWFISGSGLVLSEDLVLSEGYVPGEP